MDFKMNINDFIKDIGLKRIIVIFMLATIAFLLLPEEAINFIGGKFTDSKFIKNIITGIGVLLIVSVIYIIFSLLLNLIFDYWNKKKVIKKLDDNHIIYIKKFYDYDVNEFINNVETSTRDKYIESLKEKGIIEWIDPLIITQNTNYVYKISDEYKKMLKKYMKKWSKVK